MAEADRKGAYDEVQGPDRAWVDADPRRRELAFDPDQGAYKVNEARTAVAAEEQGVVPGPVRRALPGGDDVLDGTGTGWDIKDASSPVSKILQNANKAKPENILVDARNLSEAERMALHSEIQQGLRPGAGQVRIVGPGNN